MSVFKCNGVDQYWVPSGSEKKRYRTWNVEFHIVECMYIFGME